ncbi:MAG TPA: hypothetical protein V6D22_24665 [Candidatus Obscuribacterales bacterium]
MIGISIGIGLFVFLFSGAFISELVHNPNAGFFPGLVLAIWAARPLFHRVRVERSNFLHPVPREYNVPAKIAFAKIRDFLAETSYNFGDKWQVATADTVAGRITANLRFTDEHTHFEADARGHIHTRKERLQRFVALEVQITRSPTGSSIIQLDFCPKVEGANFTACDSIVSGITAAIDSAIGPGVAVGEPADANRPAAPLWLKGLSILALLGLLGDAATALFH